MLSRSRGMVGEVSEPTVAAIETTEGSCVFRFK